MKKLLILVVCFIIIGTIIACYLIVHIRNQEIENLEHKGNYVIQQVELYKERNHKLPQYLEDMKLNLPDDYPLYYSTARDNENYLISFQIGFFKSMVYHSDDKKWIPGD